eukprot:Nk52_evm12s2578 gene=Nk52_evmTU12s2578
MDALNSYTPSCIRLSLQGKEDPEEVPSARHLAGTCVEGETMYLLGGVVNDEGGGGNVEEMERLYKLDLVHMQWSWVPLSEEKGIGRRNGHSMVFSNGWLWVFGGLYGFGSHADSGDTVHCIDPYSGKVEEIKTNRWQTRAFHSTARKENKIFIFGGSNEYLNRYLNDLWCFDTQSRQWECLCEESSKKDPTPRISATFSHIYRGGKPMLLLFGGYAENASRFNRVANVANLFLFDLERGVWIKNALNPTAPRRRRIMSVTNLGYTQDRLLLFSGGRVSTSDGSSELVLFDTERLIFKNLHTPQLKMVQMEYHHSVSLGSKVLLLGGRLKGGLLQPLNVAYSLESDLPSRPLFQCFFNDFHRLLSSGNHSDCVVTIGAEECEFKCHSVILMARSAYFEKLLTCGMEESKTKVIHFPEFEDPVVFECVLEYIYTGYIKSFCCNTACSIIPMADALLLDNLKVFCEEKLIHEGFINQVNVSSIFLASENYNCPSLNAHCRDYIATHFKDMLNEDEFKDKVVTRPDIIIGLLKELKIQS